MKLLPTGRQVFEEIRNENLLYVDKTHLYHKLFTSGKKQFFLSRPRRFGKTLLCWTLDSIFSGRKDLFEGLAIAKTDWKWEKHPVIRLDMSEGDFSKGLASTENAVTDLLDKNAAKLGVKLNSDSLSIQFSQLIRYSAQKHGRQAVVIIDEYDNPLLSVIDNKEEFDNVRKFFRDFYRVVKASESDLKFALLTGVTKFSKVSVFSALNNLTDITLEPEYADICGITQNELELNFSEYINKFAGDNEGKENYLKKLKKFYNGYRFSEDNTTVYNPFGILKHFESGKFKTYWYETGTPNYLISLIDNDKTDILTIPNTRVTDASFRKYDLENMEAVPMLYQAGYLTVSDYNDELGIYTLNYPNTEVRAAFSDELAVKYLKIPVTSKESLITNLPTYLFAGDINSAIELAIKPFMAEIPNNMAIRQEKYFQTIFHIIFNMLGLKCRSEVSIATGRIDSVVETPKYVYCFEFKLDNTTPQEALKQIDANEYLTSYKGKGKTIFKVGVRFNVEERKIQDWAFEQM